VHVKAFVTGSTGFLGTHLLQELAAGGWDICAFHRATSDLSELKAIDRVTSCVGDVRDRDSVYRAMPEEVDAVFHAAGSVGFLRPEDEQEQYDINVLGARHVVDAALARKARRFIYTSTVLTYDFSCGQRISEASQANTASRSAYIHSKHLADLEVEKGARAGLDSVVLHPSAILGAHDKSTWSKIFREVHRGLRIPAAPPGMASFCHMRKVAQAHVSAFHRGRRGEHYLLGGADHTMKEVATKVAEILGRRGPWGRLPGFLFRLFGRLEYRLSTLLGKEPMVTPSLADMLCETVLCDSSKAIAELGYEPSSLHTMLMDCYQWMVEANLLPPPETPRQPEPSLATNLEMAGRGQ
jgi:nucleoside-diphosphate-sugar epimerase